MPIIGGILPAPEAGSSLLSGHPTHNALDPREAKRVRLDASIDPYTMSGRVAFLTLIFSESFSTTYGLFFPDI